MDNITNQSNNLRPEYVTRIVNAVKYKGADDHEDVWSILYEYEQKIKSNFGLELYMLQDIINHQRTEIERLKTEIGIKDLEYSGLERERAEDIGKFAEELEVVKIKAYKEVVGWLKEEIKDSLFAYEASQHCERIDNILNEKLGEYNAI